MCHRLLLSYEAFYFFSVLLILNRPVPVEVSSIRDITRLAKR